MLFTAILNFVLLVFCWKDGDVSLLVKSIFTLVFLASFALILTSMPALCVVAQCALAAVIGATTFGPEWLMRDPWGRGRR
jgi:hypothetical protein